MVNSTFPLFISIFLNFYSLQENQAREKKKVAKEKEAKNEERKQNRELAKEGKAPVFMSKTERKTKDLVDKYEELKSTGKIDKYLKKKAKKNQIKDRKKMSDMNNQRKYTLRFTQFYYKVL